MGQVTQGDCDTRGTVALMKTDAEGAPDQTSFRCDCNFFSSQIIPSIFSPRPAAQMWPQPIETPSDTEATCLDILQIHITQT